MLTVKAEIKRGEQRVDGTYNVKIRFTLGRQVKRLSTSLFAASFPSMMISIKMPCYQCGCKDNTANAYWKRR